MLKEKAMSNDSNLTLGTGRMADDNKQPAKLRALLSVRAHLLHLGEAKTPMQAAVLLTLASYADPSGYNARPKQQTIADILGCNERTVGKALAYWKKLGVIVEQSGPNNSYGRGVAAVYRIVLEKEGGESSLSDVKEGLEVSEGGPERNYDFGKDGLEVVKVGREGTLPNLPSKEKTTVKGDTVAAASPEGIDSELQAYLEGEIDFTEETETPLELEFDPDDYLG
jgi:helix-turn-helix protein